MAQAFEVKSGDLMGQAGYLRRYNQNVRTEAQNMQGFANDLNGKWEGEAKSSFAKSVADNLKLVDTFCQMIDEFIKALEQNASTYETAEGEAKRIASSKGQ